eukprot:TRINITY_DN6799_c1_g2_i1.p1 TRINITY_DN6799_c1_g2~~TRINITY_DN6799_c1_g2_i1.p1  ORF type:complete len:412 (+),score=91.51 TRINITY_DN6799_c1_g2_i1:99-1238(+)
MRSAVAAVAFASAASACRGVADCSGAGECVAGVCKCDRGWSGAQCETFNLGPGYACGSGGLCMRGELNNVASWGGDIVLGDDGKYHMYAAMFPGNLTLNSWLYDGRIGHAVSDRPEGPYTGKDISLGSRGDGWNSSWDSRTVLNPAIRRAPNGTYLLYYMGASQSKGEADFDCRSGRTGQATCMQRVGMATAERPEGPWVRRDEPIIGPGPAGSWDDMFTTNPTPYVYPNGSVLMLYKARSIEKQSVMSTGVAFADHWAGPYVRTGIKLDVPANCEDAGIYRSPATSVFKVLFHCGCTYRYAWSTDGFAWNTTAGEVAWCDYQLVGGGSAKVSRRERPMFVLGAGGDPTHILTAVMPTEQQGPEHGSRAFTMAAEITAA